MTLRNRRGRGVAGLKRSKVGPYSKCHTRFPGEKGKYSQGSLNNAAGTCGIEVCRDSLDMFLEFQILSMRLCVKE